MAESIRMITSAEVWVPEGDRLVFGSGAYAAPVAPSSSRKPKSYRYGEGLPGAAWATHRALLWRDAGDDADSRVTPIPGLGVPWFNGARLLGVVKLALAPAPGLQGCIELWTPNDALDTLRHEGGYYPELPEFEKLSHLLQFTRGTGLPGMTWESGECQVMSDVTRSVGFVRADLAERAGLKAGAGIPVYYDGAVEQVVTMLAGKKSPFLHTFELFTPGTSGVVALSRLSPAEDAGGAPAQHSETSRLLAESVAQRGVPAVSSVDGAICLAVPIHDGNQLRRIVCLTLG